MAERREQKQKAQFSQSEREELQKAFDAGMNSIAKGKLPLIKEVSHKLQRSEEEIRVRINFNWK